MNEMIRSFKPNGGKNVKKGLLNMWTTKCRTLMGLLLQELNKKKWGWHPLFDIFKTIPTL
jgi:hypothetical protein